jgi:hypothetical protein
MNDRSSVSHVYSSKFAEAGAVAIHGALTFFKPDYFKQRALAAADAAGKHVRWFVIDAIPIGNIDVNGQALCVA